MAIIHISEADAARDLSGLLAKVRAGEDIRIDSGLDTYTIIPLDAKLCGTRFYGALPGLLDSASSPQPRKLSEAIRLAEARGSNVTLDRGFGDDLEEIIRSREHERLIDPWESF